MDAVKLGAVFLAGSMATRAFVAGPSAGPSLRASQAAVTAAEPIYLQQEGSFSAASSVACGAATLGAAAVLAQKAAKASRCQKVSRRSGKRSPGYNTLPEWEAPPSGFKDNLGDQAPLGLWDPAGFTKDGDIDKFVRRREVEFKHGRVAMIATIGYIVPEYTRLPGELSPSQGLKFEDVPNGLAALSKVPVVGWAQIIAFIGFLELKYNQKYGEPGNYGKGFLSLGSLGINASIQDSRTREKKLNADLANGRLAMMAIIGMFFQDGLTGSAWGDWANYTASPLSQLR